MVISVVALAGCGDGEAVVGDHSQATLEEALARVVEEQTGTEHAQVTCPKDPDEGDVCNVTTPGGVRAQIRITSIAQDGGVDGDIVQP